MSFPVKAQIHCGAGWPVATAQRGGGGGGPRHLQHVLTTDVCMGKVGGKNLPDERM